MLANEPPPPRLTSAMATAPFSVKVLSFKLMTRNRGLMENAWARAVTPGWLIPFCGMWTSSRVPMICRGKRAGTVTWSYSNMQQQEEGRAGAATRSTKGCLSFQDTDHVGASS